MYNTQYIYIDSVQYTTLVYSSSYVVPNLVEPDGVGQPAGPDSVQQSQGAHPVHLSSILRQVKRYLPGIPGLNGTVMYN